MINLPKVALFCSAIDEGKQSVFYMSKKAALNLFCIHVACWRSVLKRREIQPKH